jgi:hypothetical protein
MSPYDKSDVEVGWENTHATTARICETVARDMASSAERSASIDFKAARIRGKFTAMGRADKPLGIEAIRGNSASGRNVVGPLANRSPPRLQERRNLSAGSNAAKMAQARSTNAHNVTRRGRIPVTGLKNVRDAVVLPEVAARKFAHEVALS